MRSQQLCPSEKTKMFLLTVKFTDITAVNDQLQTNVNYPRKVLD